MAFSQKRIPIAGSFGLVSEDAQCRAGDTSPACVARTVKRSAWSIAPARTSS